MFGRLTPELNHVSEENKQRYRSAYCNLCAALSGSGMGPLNRFFLINDVVTTDWLFTDEKNDCQPFACTNCLKGGVLGKKKNIQSHQKLLAAVSTFVCGVKITDNAHDKPSLYNKCLKIIYRPMMKKAERTLKTFNVLDKLQDCLTVNHKNEALGVSTLEEATQPTEECYEIIAQSLTKTKFYTTLSQKVIGSLGRYLGRCAYLLDALKDMDDDKTNNQYNILNIISDQHDSPAAKENAVTRCLEFLKPMRIDLTELLTLLPDNGTYNTIREKCESLFFSIEHQLAKIIHPMNNNHLTDLLNSFSSYSSWALCAHQPSLSNCVNIGACPWEPGKDSMACCRGGADKCAAGGCPCR